MLEAYVHNQLKDLLKASSCPWPHNLTLSRLVARSLRCRDHSLVQLEVGSNDFWWLGLLIPLSFDYSSAVLVLSAKQRHRLFSIELPRLKQEGLTIACWEGSQPPPDGQLWVIDHVALIHAFHDGLLKSKHLIVPEAELLSERLKIGRASCRERV